MLEVQTVGHAAGQVIQLLAAGPGDDHDGRVPVLGEAGLIVAVDARDLVDGGLAGIVHLGGGFVLIVNVGIAQLLVDVDHGLVQVVAGALKVKLIAGPSGSHSGSRRGPAGAHGPGHGIGEISFALAQGLLQADVRALGLYAEAGAQQVGMGADAQQRHVGSGAEGQRIIFVLQQHAALGRLPAVQVDGRRDQGVGIAGAVGVEILRRGREFVIQRIAGVLLGDESRTDGAQGGVDGAGVGLHDAARRQGQAQHEDHQGGQTAPQAAFCLCKHFFTSPPHKNGTDGSFFRGGRHTLAQAENNRLFLIRWAWPTVLSGLFKSCFGGAGSSFPGMVCAAGNQVAHRLCESTDSAAIIANTV